MAQATNWQTPTNSTDNDIDVVPAFDRIDEMMDAILSGHSGATRPSYAVAGTVWLDTDTNKHYLYDGTSDIELVQRVAVPATASSTGKEGQIAFESGGFYTCVADDTWETVATATF